MVLEKSLDEVINIIAALLHDVSNVHGLVFNTRALRLTLNKVKKRARTEGFGFLTKTMPRLAKAFDKALTEQIPLNSVDLGFKPMVNSKLPSFLGEFFSRVLTPDGTVLQDPCISSVKVIRDVLYLFYKYELPYTDVQEQLVLDKFERTDHELATKDIILQEIAELLSNCSDDLWKVRKYDSMIETARVARVLLSELFRTFDPLDIIPRHGPGVVATKQRLWGKYLWTNVSRRVTDVYPFDAYFCASQGHVCDCYRRFSDVDDRDLPAKVILVPKDSRGPRLISCEPVEFQWVQQGLGRAIVKLVEGHYLTKYNVHFTDQLPNGFGALLGSKYGRYSTLDLNEASDRVSLGLVRLLFPDNLYKYLSACRTTSTTLPNGQVIPLNKFAPMGSSLCFPILALTVWAILTAAAPDADTREGILVYGDDVIVPTAYAADAMEQLESFGLKINRDKSCTKGFFRESCGVDAFKGINVTPVRLRTVWSSAPSPNVYSSWVAYANSFYTRQYYRTSELITQMLLSIYGQIPDKDMNLSCPSLYEVPAHGRPQTHRFNKSLQKLEYKVWDIKASAIIKEIDGWSMLLRYYTEGHQPNLDKPLAFHHERVVLPLLVESAFSVSSYTSRDTSMLVKRWR